MGFLLDLRYALRLLAKSPKFTVLTSFILMGGLTVSLLTFNFVYTIAFKPLDTPDGASIVTVSVQGQYDGGRILAKDVDQFEKRMLDEIYDEYSYYYREEVRLSTPEAGKNLIGDRVSSNFFEFTRFKPLLGRSFTTDDQNSGASNVVVISYRVWQSMFAGDDNVIGQTVNLDQGLYEVIAVMPKGYQFPVGSDLWLPMKNNAMVNPVPQNLSVNIMARLNPGVTIEQADQKLSERLTSQTYDRLSTSEREGFNRVWAEHMSLVEQNMQGSGAVMFVALQSVALAILLMACINTGNLIFARSIERQKETAIRSALGATKKRLVRQLVIEGGLLTLIGGFLALILTGWLLFVLDNLIKSIVSSSLPFWWHWQMDWQTLLVAVSFMLFTFFFACLLPALKAVNMDINKVLRDGTRGALGRGAGRISRILVTVQIALIAVLMLIGSLGSAVIYNVITVMGDEQSTNRFEANFDLHLPQYEQPAQRAAFISNMLLQLKAQSAIEDAGLLENLGGSAVRLDGQEQGRIDILSSTGNLAFFDLTIVKGRDIDSRDNDDNTRVALVSESFVQRYLPGQDPLGKLVDINIDEQFVTHQIVGVVSDKGRNTQATFAAKSEFDEIYTSHYQRTYQYPVVVFKTTQDSRRGEEDFYRVVQQLNVKPMFNFLTDQTKNANLVVDMLKLTTKIIIYSGIFSLFLALIGVYGVSASVVAMRSHEIGIRRALGAKNAVVIRLFLKRNMMPLVIGLGGGLIIYALSCFIFSGIVGARIQLSMYISIALVTSIMLSLMLCLSAYFPTRQAIAKEPAATLRAD